MKQQLSTLVVSAILLTACGSVAPEQPTATLAPPTATLPPTFTTTPEPTFTPTTTPTPRLPVTLGTQLPVPDLAISADNVDDVVELAHWGQGVITGAAYSPDGTHIAVASTLGISILQADTLDEILYFESSASISSIAYSPDGKAVATGLSDNTVKMWQTSDGELLMSFENHKGESASKDAVSDEMTHIAFSPDGSLLAGGSSDNMVNLWEVSEGSLVYTFENHTRDITSVFFSPDGQTLFSASEDGKVRMIDVSEGKLVNTLTGEFIGQLTISADGETLVGFDYSGIDSSFVLWNFEDGNRIKSMQISDLYVPDQIASIALSPDGQFLIAGWNDYSAKIWSLESGTVQATYDDLRPMDGWYYLADFIVAFSPDGQSFLMAGSDVIGTWDFKKGTLLKSSIIKSQSIYDIALSPDGRTLSTVEGPNVSLLNISDGSLITTDEPIQSNGSVDFSPDGATLAAAMFDRTVQLWPLSEQGLRRTFEPGAGRIWKVAFSPDGETLAVGLDDSPTVNIEILQVSDGALLRTMAPGYQFAYPIEAIFSPDGQLLAAAYGDQLKLYQVADGKAIRSYTSVYRPVFSADGTFLAAAGTADNSWRMWKVPSGDSVFSIKDRPNSVLSLVFSPDNTMVVTGGADGTIEVFLVSDGTLITSWKAHSRAVSDVIFTSDGKFLISASYDGTVRVWGIKP